MVEDRHGLNNGWIGEEAFLAQCGDALNERVRMMTYELERFDEGLFFCLFDTPDRVQHMFWRDGARTVEEHYRELYSGPYAHESPDLLVNYAGGYRVSWATSLGGIPATQFEDNLKRWSGDHLIDPALVPGVLFMNRPFRGAQADLRDMAPTILAALNLPKGGVMEGESLLQ